MYFFLDLKLLLVFLKTAMRKVTEIIPIEHIETAILLIRGQKVILDTVLAELYGVETRSLIQAVKRNQQRFPSDFMFQLDNKEFSVLRSQNVISKPEGRGGRRTPPYAFTEQGVAMLSSVLKSDRAVEVNIGIMRAFVRLRELLLTNEALNRKLVAMERNYDERFQIVFSALKQLMDTPAPKDKRKIGFLVESQK